MSKAKDKIDEIRNKIFEKKKETMVEEADAKILATMENVAYDVIQDPNSKSRAFIMVKIAYDLETKTAKIVEVRPFGDKAAGLSITMDKENRKYLFEKNRSRK